jgi:hypothetical protein
MTMYRAIVNKDNRIVAFERSDYKLPRGYKFYGNQLNVLTQYNSHEPR